VKKSITFNILARSILGISMILGTCTAIAVGVAGGYRSPLSASPEAGTVETSIADTQTASLLRSVRE
jgi:hypothetical protein